MEDLLEADSEKNARFLTEYIHDAFGTELQQPCSRELQQDKVDAPAKLRGQEVEPCKNESRTREIEHSGLRRSDFKGKSWDQHRESTERGFKSLSEGISWSEISSADVRGESESEISSADVRGESESMELSASDAACADVDDVGSSLLHTTCQEKTLLYRFPRRWSEQPRTYVPLRKTNCARSAASLLKHSLDSDEKLEEKAVQKLWARVRQEVCVNCCVPRLARGRQEGIETAFQSASGVWYCHS